MPIQVTFLGLSGLQLWDADTPTLIPVAVQHQPLSTPDGDNSRAGEGGLPGEQQSAGFSKVAETIFSGWSREHDWNNTGEWRDNPPFSRYVCWPFPHQSYPFLNIFSASTRKIKFFYPPLIENGGCMEYGTHFRYIISKPWNCPEFVESDTEIRSPDS